MANSQMGPVDFGFVDKRRTRDHGALVLSEANSYDAVSDMRSRLNTLSATSYTAARLDAMTVNDMVYALRVASSDNAGI